MSSVDQQSDALERMEPGLSAELEEKEIVASDPEGNYSKECPSCQGTMNKGRQLRNTIKTLREKLNKKREALRAAQLKLKGRSSIQTNDYGGSSCSSRHFEIWRRIP